MGKYSCSTQFSSSADALFSPPLSSSPKVTVLVRAAVNRLHTPNWHLSDSEAAFSLRPVELNPVNSVVSSRHLRLHCRQTPFHLTPKQTDPLPINS